MSESYRESVSTEGTSFTFTERLGLVFVVEVAFLSFISTGSVLFYYLYLHIAAMRNPSRTSPSTHVHHYFASLLFADMVQALGSILNIQWIQDGLVHENTLCMVQGALKQIGDVGVALSTLAIAAHTTRVLVFRVEFSQMIPKLVLGAIWVFVAAMFILGFGTRNARGIQFYGDTGYWCWITDEYATERITLEYLWLWVSAAFNILCYTTIFLVIKGYLVIDGKATHFQTGYNSFGLHWSQITTNTRTNTIARQMLYYPAVYLVCILPMTVSRFIAFGGGTPPHSVTVFSSILFSASGLFNVILFKITRPTLLPGRRFSSRTVRPHQETLPPFHATKRGSGMCSPGTGIDTPAVGQFPSPIPAANIRTYRAEDWT